MSRNPKLIVSVDVDNSRRAPVAPRRIIYPSPPLPPIPRCLFKIAGTCREAMQARFYNHLSVSSTKYPAEERGAINKHAEQKYASKF